MAKNYPHNKIVKKFKIFELDTFDLAERDGREINNSYLLFPFEYSNSFDTRKQAQAELERLKNLLYGNYVIITVYEIHST